MEKTVRIDILSSGIHFFGSYPHVTRGQILAGVLSGTASYDSIPIMTDSVVTDGEPDIEYNPTSDQRLDRFDAVELGLSVIDEKVPTKPVDPPSPTEEKE